MVRHPVYGFWQHTDDELAPLLPSPVRQRQRLHQWNLSAVELLCLADGQLAVYKSQWGPTKEAEFYRDARSPLLCATQVVALPDSPPDAYPGLVLEHHNGPRLRGPGESRRALRIWEEIRGALQDATGLDRRLAHTDIGGLDAWLTYAASVLDHATRVCSGPDVVAALRFLSRWSESAGVLEAVGQDVGLLHGDLHCGNVIESPRGLRLVDWQRPRWGPRDLDAVCLFWSLGHSPLISVDATLVAIQHFVSAGWQLEVTGRWIPGIGDPVEIVTGCARRIAAVLGERL